MNTVDRDNRGPEMSLNFSEISSKYSHAEESPESFEKEELKC